MKLNNILLRGVLLDTTLPPPVANFSASPLSGQIPLNVNFTDLSTNSPTSWAWDFTNNGSTDSTLQNPSTTYSTAGTYSVKLTATNSGGSDIITKIAYITATPAALSGNLNTYYYPSTSNGTIAYFATVNPISSHSYGNGNFFVTNYSSFYAANTIYLYQWDGTTHNRTTIVNASSWADSYRRVYGMYRDPRGFLIYCVGNSILSPTQFKLRTIYDTTENQTTAINENNYSGTVTSDPKFLPIGAILPDPDVTNGYIGVLISGTASDGKYTLIRFTVDNSGIISNITFTGSRSSAPTFNMTNSSGLSAIIGLDDKIYFNNSSPSSGSTGGLWSIEQDGSSYTTHFTTYSSENVGGGIALDDVGNIYLGGQTVVPKVSWTGSNYNYAGVSTIAGLSGSPALVDGALGVNRILNYTTIANNLGNGTLGLFTLGVGGTAGFYRILS